MHLNPTWRRQLVAVAGVLALLGTLLTSPPAAEAADDDLLPIVFVHGGAGSGAQYHAQAMRWTSNGYPADLLSAFEYDGGNVIAAILGQRTAPLLAHIEAVLAEHDADQVHLVGHSLGTSVSNLFMVNLDRRALVASYTGVDGSGVTTCPVGVRCLGIWANATSQIAGAERNVNLPDQTHVEVATSAESFAAQHEFITGTAPRTTLVLPEPPGQVRISGRAVNFPANTGTAGATLNLYEVDARTGHRKHAQPQATQAIGEDGAWGPFRVNGQQHYEFELVREGLATAHLYSQPFLRSSDLVRVLATPVGSQIAANTNSGDGHVAAVVVREREWWGSREPQDQLWIGTRSASGDVAAIDALAGVTANNTIGVHVHDAAATPGVSTGNLLPYFPSQAFQTGVDVFMPASSPPDGTVSFVSVPRGDLSRQQTVNVPNWPSSAHRINVRFNDYVQDVTTWGECKRLKPSPC
jgi:pimeloyl-ACP methyl ester carboxylesterase